MMKHIQTEDPSLVRDPSNHALLNTNSEAWRLYKAQRDTRQNAAVVEQRVAKLEEELSHVRSSLDMIIELLQKK